MQDLVKQDVLLSPSEIIVQMQKEMFKSNLSKEVEELKTGLLAFTSVESEIQAASATGLLNMAKKIRKIGEDKRKEKTESLDNTKKMAIQAERDFFKGLDDMISSVNQAVLAFKQEQVRIANVKAAAIKEEAERAANRKRSVAGVAKVQEEANKALAEVQVPSGMRKSWKYEIINKAQVPAEFLIVDETKVKQAIKNGTREIAGIRIFEDYGLSGR